MSADRCQVLLEVLERSREINDFAKRTLASFIVLELHAAFTMLRRARSKKIGLGPPRPKPVEEVEAQVDALLAKGAPFASLRDKIVAHLDGDVDVRTARELWQQLTWARVASWVTLLLHYIEVLRALFPDEYTTHFKMRNLLMATVAPSRTPPSREDYEPFDDPTGA
jgi:hypothetical protein